ncbi:MAG TPA: hypothetical protein VGS21_00620, partial [Acidimicrobiales bacterium]|nr:hypothetical protein [Acidimicrobiales bacterium]
MPVPLDEYPLHQAPLSMREVATTDRNAYDRCYVNAHDRTGELFVVTGLGVYPNLGVTDAFLTVMVAGRQTTLRVSDPLGDDRLSQRVGPCAVEVLEPLRRIRVVWDDTGSGVSADLVWTGSFPPVDEARHRLERAGRVIVDSMRFAQVGTCEGSVVVDGTEHRLSGEASAGTRDRSWGIRPVGESEPPGRAASEPMDDFGFWWTYVPLRFDDFAIVLIAQEDGKGSRSLNEAVRVWPASTGRPPEPLGWPEFGITYRSGTRHPEGVRVTLARRHEPLEIEIETLGHVALNAGPGYNGDPTWTHGSWRGRGWSERVDVDLSDPEVAG